MLASIAWRDKNVRNPENPMYNSGGSRRFCSAIGASLRTLCRCYRSSPHRNAPTCNRTRAYGPKHRTYAAPEPHTNAGRRAVRTALNGKAEGWPGSTLGGRPRIESTESTQDPLGRGRTWGFSPCRPPFRAERSRSLGLGYGLGWRGSGRLSRSSRSNPIGRLAGGRPRCVDAHSKRAQTLKYPPPAGAPCGPELAEGRNR